jgi:hypothetical protein
LKKAVLSTATREQERRMLAALRKGPVTTIRARSDLDVLHPAGRVMSLRQQGHNILTANIMEPTDSGVLHRVARYVLVKGKRASR